MSGLMSITGNERSGPQKVGIAITDVLTGLYACIGIQAALLERETSGKGQKLDVALYDSAVSSLINIASNYFMSKKVPTLLGNDHANIVPYRTFQTKDREIVIAVGNNQQFVTLCQLLHLPDLANDPKFSTNANRVKNQQQLVPLLQAELLKERSDHWIETFRNNNVPCGPIQTIDQLEDDPQLQQRNMFLSMHHPTAGEIQMIGSPLKLSRTPVKFAYHPPNVGEDTEQILKSLGYTEKQIDDYEKNHFI